MRRALPCVLLAIVSVRAAAADTWTNLWLTQEQQAQRLLSAGKPAEAAPLFQDRRRRAYSELAAGQYAEAARHFSGLRDPDSQYNRGNALAHVGDLKGALAAYDAALADRPSDRDARHNRELVERALRQQQQSQPGQAQKPSGGKQQSSPSGTSGQMGESKQAGQSGQGQEDGRAGAPSGSGSSSGVGTSAKDSRGSDGGEQQQPKEQTQPGAQTQPNDQTKAGAQAKSEAQARAGQSPTIRHGESGSSTSEARASSAESSQASGRRPAVRAGETDTGTRGRAASPVRKPESEQSLALDQWLRRIPDDPAELLRRKFLVEHMLKQQNHSP